MHNTNSLHGASTGVLMALAAAVLWGTTGTAQSKLPLSHCLERGRAKRAGETCEREPPESTAD